MIKWTLWQFKNIVELFLTTQCSSEMQEILIRRLDILSEKGIDCKRPISAPLGGSLFELRGRADNKQARLIYYFGSNRRIIFTHACYKSRSQISRHDMEIAKRNKKFIEEGREKAYGLNLTH